MGSGTWGTALAILLYSNGHSIRVWSRTQTKTDILNSTHIHPNLKGVKIPEQIHFTTDLKNALENADFVFCVVPSVAVRQTMNLASAFISENQIIVSATKGIEEHTLLTMTEVISDELAKVSKNNPVVALSGPTHAEEVVNKLPTAIVSACENLSYARKVKAILNNDYFKVFGTTDRKGVELCGALKNIIALACGISDGMGYGDNAKAALITRGMAEISYLGFRLGCHEHTFFGLAGIGDMIVTSTSSHSRNRNCGFLIGKGTEVAQAVKDTNMVVEGVNVLPAAMELAEKNKVSLPIISAVNEIINNGKSPAEIQNSLLSMPATREFRTLGKYRD